MKKSKMHKKYDWETIENEYIYGYQDDNKKIFPTLSEISKRHTIPFETIRSRYYRHKWKQKKEETRIKIRTKVAERKTEFEAENIVHGNSLFENIGILGANIITSSLKRQKQQIAEGKEVPTSDILNVGRAGEKYQQIMKRSQDEMVERIQVDTTVKASLNKGTVFDRVNRTLEFMNEGSGDYEDLPKLSFIRSK